MRHTIPAFDPDFQRMIEGYPYGSLVSSRLDNQVFFVSIIDDNMGDPESATGFGWKSIRASDLQVWKEKI